MSPYGYAADPFQGASALRYDSGQFFSSLQDDYCLPVASHSPEEDRLNLLHLAYKLIIGNVPELVGSFLGSGSSRHVLDIGCGTGKWAVEVAEEFPNAQVTGIDVVHPPVPRQPLNFEWFRIQDLVSVQSYEKGKYAVVHARDLAPGIRCFPSFFGKCVEALMPGGYLLMEEIETGIFSDDPSLEDGFAGCHRFMEIFKSAMRERGLDPSIATRLEEYPRSHEELEDIQVVRHTVPLGAWPEDPLARYIGQLSRRAMEIFPNTVQIMLQDHGIADPDAIAAQAKVELDTNVHKPYWVFHSLVARKML